MVGMPSTIAAVFRHQLMWGNSGVWKKSGVWGWGALPVDCYAFQA